MNNYEKLAKNLVKYSCDVQKGERVMISQSCVDPEFLVALIKEIRNAGGLPFVDNNIVEVSKELLMGMTEEYADLKTKFMLPIMKEMDVYIGFGGSNNVFEMSDVPTNLLNINSTHYMKPVHFEERVNHTKWVILRWPTPAFAQSAGMSTKEFEKLYFNVCTLDYAKMSKAMDSLVALMEKTDKVRITAPDTDLTLSIKNQRAIKCAGKRNVPDGEVYSGPIKNSINGKITYNVPTIYNGTRFDNICFEIESGKIINATCNGLTEKLNNILNTDKGARYFGEFALGVNPYITKPILDILFDEKICGSFHLTPGACYAETPNGNESAIHWDMVLCQLPEFGGGEIYFDDVLIRKDGRFVIKELLGLNPENLI